MALIEWKDRMSVGVETLDHDHQRLIAFLNQLHDVIQGNDNHGSVSEIVRNLVRYTEYHFECEERLMRLARFPDYEEHARIHRDIRRRMVGFEQKFLAAPNENNVLPLFDFLSNWLMKHILREDMRYRPYLTGETTPATEALPTDAA